MTAKDTETRADTAVAVQVRAEGDVDEQALAYLRTKIDAVLGRPGIPAARGEVRITKATARHTEQPWSAGAELVLGDARVVVHAREATAHELADRLQDLLRSQMTRVLHRREEARRSATPPPWRGGPAGDRRG
ncbi:hypothetical protein ACFOZ0_01470 [Streptomyces yaanensis]|uniref:Uncharacterized protein n=1 Tax=Streptomyces yaanensis TaxID=1142239 RepID=A0ABV7S6D4_9ACTN|nr:hypothetical protein [Streptomyces sp. CGMCC 4.7035]WNB99575.1 hypothetical protein Q2K21_16695 [Streptomyces sp. CGMCC 4.7035]